MAEFPSFPLWVQRYKADTEHLSHEESGIYLDILMVMWISPFQRLPNDDNWLSRRFRAPPEKLRPIIKEFCQNDGNWITQKGLQKEWERVRILSQKRRDAAKSRWDKENNPFTCNAGVHMPSNAPTTIPIPIPSKESKKERKKESGNILLPGSWEPNEVHYSLGIKKGLTREEVEEAASEMRCWSEGNGEKRRNWDAVFTNWLRRNAQRRPYRNGGGSGKPSEKGAIIDTLDTIIEARRGNRLRAIESKGDDGLLPEGGSERPR